MDKKSNAFAFIVRGAVILGFFFFEHTIYKDFEKVKMGVDKRKQEMFDDIANSFIRRHSDFYLDKKYLKADFDFKEKKRIEEENRILEYRRLQAEKLLKEQELKNQEENLNSEKIDNPNINKEVENKQTQDINQNKEDKTTDQVDKPVIKRETEKTDEKKEIKTETKSESKPPKKVIPRGAVKVRVTKPVRLEDITHIPKDPPPPIKIHRVETNVYHLSDDEPKKESVQKEQPKESKKVTQKVTPIKKEKSSSFKEVKMLDN